MKLLFSTTNRGKLRELGAIVQSLGIQVLSPADVGIAHEVEEDAPTFEGNALKKARAAAAASQMPALADDSGLEVDALGGAPGVLSARFAGGVGHDDLANNRKLLIELSDIPDQRRTARFRCALAFVDLVHGREIHADGRLEGSILRAPRGENGFGYDPLFLVAGDVRSMAELSMEEKNRISHRAQAMRKMAELLR